VICVFWPGETVSPRRSMPAMMVPQAGGRAPIRARITDFDEREADLRPQRECRGGERQALAADLNASARGALDRGLCPP